MLFDAEDADACWDTERRWGRELLDAPSHGNGFYLEMEQTRSAGD